jgi:hypothetical protein
MPYEDTATTAELRWRMNQLYLKKGEIAIKNPHFCGIFWLRGLQEIRTYFMCKPIRSESFVL